MLYHFWVIILTLNKRDLEKSHWRSASTILKLGCGFLFAFHSNYGSIFNRLWDIQRQSTAWPWNWVISCSRSLEMAQFDRPYRPTIFYWSVNVNIIYLVPLLSYLTSNNIVTLKSGFEITEGHSNWYRTIRKPGWCFLFAFHSNYGSSACTNSEIKRDIGRNRHFFISLAFGAVIRRGGGRRRNIAMTFGTEKLEWFGYPMVKKIEDSFIRLFVSKESTNVTDGQRDRQTDRQTHMYTPRDGICRAYA